MGIGDLPWRITVVYGEAMTNLRSQTWCKENGPLAHLLWILVFDDQHNQIGLMNLQVFIL